MNTRCAPARRATWAVMMPTGPAPSTAVASPTLRSEARTACTPTAKGSTSAAWMSGSEVGMGRTVCRGTVTYWAKPPSRSIPTSPRVAQT